MPPKQRLLDLDEIRVNTLGNVADARKFIMSTCMYLHMHTYAHRFCVMCDLFVSALTHTHTHTHRSQKSALLYVFQKRQNFCQLSKRKQQITLITKAYFQASNKQWSSISFMLFIVEFCGEYAQWA